MRPPARSSSRHLQGTPLRELLRNPAFVLVWAVYVAGSVADCVITALALDRGLRERNPVAAALYRHAGMGALWTFKGVVLTILLLGLTRLPARVALVAAGVLAATICLDVNANLDALRSAGF